MECQMQRRNLQLKSNLECKWQQNKGQTKQVRESSNHSNTKIQKQWIYLKRMNLPDARTWFRFRCKTTNNSKGITSSSFRDNLKCSHCNSGEDETQEHLETCEYTSELRRNLDLTKKREHIILWRKINKNLRELYRKANLNTQPLNLRPLVEEGHIGSGRNRREPAPIHLLHHSWGFCPS